MFRSGGREQNTRGLLPWPHYWHNQCALSHPKPIVKEYYYLCVPSIRLRYLLQGVTRTQTLNEKELQRDYRNLVSTLLCITEVSKRHSTAAHSNIRLSKLPGKTSPDRLSRVDHNKSDTRHRSASVGKPSDHRSPQGPPYVGKDKAASRRDPPKVSRRRRDDQSSGRPDGQF
jgi:hypothetical protein